MGVEPAWVAAAGAAVLAVRALVRRTSGPVAIVRAAAPGFCLFVLALGVVVAALSARGLADGLGALLPSSTSLVALLATAGIAAVLANLVNNLPATLALLAALGPLPQPALVLAVLLGVNIGPNLTWTGSLATLLWRRVATERGEPPELGRFVALGASTVPLGLAAATVALWVSLAVRVSVNPAAGDPHVDVAPTAVGHGRDSHDCDVGRGTTARVRTRGRSRGRSRCPGRARAGRARTERARRAAALLGQARDRLHLVRHVVGVVVPVLGSHRRPRPRNDQT